MIGLDRRQPDASNARDAYRAGEPAVIGLLNHADEARLFRGLRWRLMANVVRQTLREARLRVAVATILGLVLWTGLFVVFAAGFQFIEVTIRDAITHDTTVRAILHIFFTALSVMLIVSTGIILYGSLYRSEEVDFLLTTPASTERIFLYKFQEAVLLSSWAFLLLSSPMLVAYGIVQDVSWTYYVLLLPLLVGFVYVPGSIGAVCCLVIVRRLPTNRRQIIWLATLGAVLLAAWIMWSTIAGVESDLLTPGWFQEMLARVRVSESRLLPSWWLSSGLLEAARGGLATGAARGALFESLLFLALLASNALLIHQIALWTAARSFRAGYSALLGEQVSSRRRRMHWIDRTFMALLPMVSYEMRLLLVKDLRLFRRDPMQWLQFTIFFGLLGLYFSNTRRLTYDLNYATWVNVISFLNVAVVGLILSTFTTRFIFPMISLEGHRLWILGLLPTDRSMILWGKFLFALISSLLPCALLILLSDLMLRVPPLIVIVHLGICVLLSTGLSAIAVGLGARLPNLRDQSPSRIAAGFGGTLNLVVSCFYIIALVLMSALPCHAFVAAHRAYHLEWVLVFDRLGIWLALGLLGSLVLGVLATLLPLRMGFRAFRTLEF